MHNTLDAAFNSLDSILTRTQPLWRPQAFTGSELSWCETHPLLRDALLALGEDEARHLHDDQQRRLLWFRALEPDLCDALYAFEPAPTSAGSPLALTRFDHVGVPGRKWQQITAFAAALPRAQSSLVDWCAGKGHLGRIVQRSQQQQLHCLEWDTALVAAGVALAKKHQLEIHYHHHDVRQTPPAPCNSADNLHMALHACGELHIQLLQHVIRSGAKAVALSPCCYHKIAADHYQPLSEAAKRSQLAIDRPTLQLAVQDTVTARRGERRLREKERLWRLGFDAMQRELRGCDNYLSVPSTRRQLLRQDFPAFCQWAAATRQLPIPASINYEHFLQRGRQRYQMILRLELLRRLFNRPLEIWLVLDRALYLQEHGYHVTVSRFCDSRITPRNLFILGQR